ncbi:hypothetical protein L7F22_029000 [Adiantum nelumboides]|nr:hypothetical protein [Adiantum nelumboides]
MMAAAYQAPEEYKQELDREKQFTAKLLKEKNELELKLKLKDQLIQAQQANVMMQEQNHLLGRKLESRQSQLDLKEEQLKRAWRHKELIEQSIMSKYLLQTLQDISTPVVSYLGDLDNKSDEENDDEEDNEDPAGTSGHQGPDDGDNDDADLLGTGPSTGALIDPPPPSTSHTDPLATTGTDVDHSHDTGAAEGQQDTTALLTHKKRSVAMVPSSSKEMAISTALVSSTRMEMTISTMVSSIGIETTKSTAMVPSRKGKEKAIIDSTDSLSIANPWLYKEFRLAEQVQLKEYLKADDMFSDMKRLADLYNGVKNTMRDGLSQLKSAQDTWDQKLQHILDFSTSSSTLSHKPMTIEYQEKNIKNMIHVIRVFKRMMSQENDILINYFELMPDPPALLYAMCMEETELPRFYSALYPPHTEPADQMTYIQIVEQIGEWWGKAKALWKEWIAVINEVEQKKTVKEFKTSVGEFGAGMRS